MFFMKKQKLVRISTYARSHNRSVQWVYSLIKSGKVKYEIVDGVKFIIL